MLPIVSVRGVAVTSGAWSAIKRKDSMEITVDESNQILVLDGSVHLMCTSDLLPKKGLLLAEKVVVLLLKLKSPAYTTLGAFKNALLKLLQPLKSHPSGIV